MLKPIIPLVLAAAVCSAQADVQVQVSPMPEQLKSLKPVAVAESNLEERKRLDRIDSIVQRFNLKKDEKFIYSGNKTPNPSLGLLDVVYKVYPEDAQLKVVKLDVQKGYARIYPVDPEDIQPYTSFAASPLDARIASDILNPGASATRSKAYFKEWYDTYQSSRVKLARKIVASDACETVTSVELYSFNGDVFTAFCGNGMAISQTPAEIEAEQPIDPAIKKWVVKRPR
ncbi:MULTISPECIES: hypothetical protein [unclassified Pseudomonas]|uniref:hypothetical protein n=1 Tax=unclassified Pseudomonas TaxID=196821 RepID=UPI000CCFFE0D|nr:MULTISPECIES: hypothetical protein [unclassified Pseudomonas]POA26485.1 hypothetical protein C1887_28620 [Pseudomonas sp. GW456-R21]POA64935.1 hypothetical protein C1884_19290 [Pseudomonas sp. GW460-R15]